MEADRGAQVRRVRRTSGGGGGLEIRLAVAGRSRAASIDCRGRCPAPSLISPFVRRGLSQASVRSDRRTDRSSAPRTNSINSPTRLTSASRRRMFRGSPKPTTTRRRLDLHAKLLAWESEGWQRDHDRLGERDGSGLGVRSERELRGDGVAQARPRHRRGCEGLRRTCQRTSCNRGSNRYVRQTAVATPSGRQPSAWRTSSVSCARTRFAASTTPVKKTLRLLAPSSTGEQTWPAGMRAEIVPLLQRDQAAARGLPTDLRSGAAFHGIELEDVAAFALRRGPGTSTARRRTRVCRPVRAEPRAARGGRRDKAVNARLLEGVDRSQPALGRPSGPAWRNVAVLGRRDSPGRQASDPLLRRATIERILEACTADPSRISRGRGRPGGVWRRIEHEHVP